MIRLEDQSSVGLVLADLRVMHQYTQRQLAAEAGVRQARLSAWETGVEVPTVPLLLRVLPVLDSGLAIVPAAVPDRGAV